MNTNKKKWLLLGAVATALLIIPRRSSPKADVKLSKNEKMNNDNTHSASTVIK